MCLNIMSLLLPYCLTSCNYFNDPETLVLRYPLIAFTSNRNGSVDIFLMNKDGSNPTRLTNGFGMCLNPKFSPDGTKIVFCHFFRIMKYIQ